MKRSAFLLPSLLLIAGCTAPMGKSVSAPMPDGDFMVGSPAPEAAATTSSDGFRMRRNAAPRTMKSAGAASEFIAPAGRKMTYTTRLTINIPDTVQGVKKASEIARKHQGYIVFSDNNSANIKIPVAKADAALKDFEAIGVVASKSITANDVTELYTDTKVRLDNLRRLQKRLGELLSRATKVDEMLRIERELSRVTTDLERWQARMNVLNNQIEMVDFYLSFTAIIKPTQIPRSIIPVKWVRDLGVTICNEIFTATSQTDDAPAEFALPAGFAVTIGTEYAFNAANAENVVMKLTPYDNLPGADIAFYQALIEKQLKYAGYTAIEFKKGKTAASADYLAVTATSEKNRLAIMIAIHDDGWFCKDEKVFVFELFGPADALKKVDLKKLYESVKF